MSTIDDFNKKIGSKIIFHGKDLNGRKIESLPTGLLNLDEILGCGGFPKGRIVKISGLQSTSKTSLCLSIIAKLQREGTKCCFVDAEYALNLPYAQNLGVDTNNLLIVEPETGEQAFEAIETILRENLASFIVVDSVSALVVRSEAEAETGKATMGGQARLISQGLRKILGLLKKKKATLVFISQLRANIMGGQYDPYTESGGMALGFYTSVSLRLSKDKAIMEGDLLKGYTIKVKVIKNKVGPPGKSSIISLFFEKGFSEEADILAIAEEKGIIKRVKTTLWFGTEKLGLGKKNALIFLSEHPEIADEILKKIKA